MTILSKIFLTTTFILLFDWLIGKYIFNSKQGLIEILIKNKELTDFLNSVLGFFLLFDLVVIAICVLQFIWTGEASWFFIK